MLMQHTRQFVGAAVAVLIAVGVATVPAHATVHEIVAQWCSGHAELEPPGLSRPGSKNFAQPLNAMGIIIVRPFGGNDLLITFDYAHRATKVQSSGLVVPIGTTEQGGILFLDVPEPDPDFPAFQHCPALASL
jgi:hypothetical protein